MTDEQMVMPKTFILAYRLWHPIRKRFLSANKSSNTNPYLGTFFTLRGLRSKVRQAMKYKGYRYDAGVMVYQYEMHIDGSVIPVGRQALVDMFPELKELQDADV